MANTSYHMGHKIVYDQDTKCWCYCDDLSSIEQVKPCAKCGKLPTKEGHDPCIANLPGVKNACCGHGVREGYIQFDNEQIIRGNFTRIYKKTAKLVTIDFNDGEYYIDQELRELRNVNDPNDTIPFDSDIVLKHELLRDLIKLKTKKEGDNYVTVNSY